jgi:Ca2+-binding EF-hand superfamily protein
MMNVLLAIVFSAIIIARPQVSIAPRVMTNPYQVFNKLDANRDGKLTRSEIPKAQRPLFDKLLKLGDANKDGVLSRREFDHMVQRLDSPTMSVKDWSFPGNGSSQSSRPAASAAAASQTSRRTAARQLMPGQLPADPGSTAPGDLTLPYQASPAGSVTHSARQKRVVQRSPKKVVLERATERTSSEEPFITPDATPDLFEKVGSNYLIHVLKRADANGDGKLSKEEAPPFLKKRFSQIDTNGDGLLDKAELETWYRQRRTAGNSAEGGGANKTNTQGAGL